MMQTLELKVPPPAVMLLFAVMMWLLAAYVPSLAMPVPWQVPVALLVWSAGVAIAVAALLEFLRAHTTVNPLNPEAASVMVTSGIYRFSRNPMYLGLLLALLGWAAWLSHLLALSLLPLFVLYINRFQIEPEERALSVKFGGQFREYRGAVRRWL